MEDGLKLESLLEKKSLAEVLFVPFLLRVGNVLPLVLYFLLNEDFELAFGPRDSLIVFGIVLNTWTRYIAGWAVCFYANITTNTCKQIVKPCLLLNIYDRDKTQITGISRHLLHFYGTFFPIAEQITETAGLYVALEAPDFVIGGIFVRGVQTFINVGSMLADKSF